MKIITWNCNMVYREKAGLIAKEQPDIVIIPECEEPGRLKFGKSVAAPNDMLWYGSNKHKGLGVFSYTDFTFKLSRTHNPAIQTVLPIIASNKRKHIRLFAVWANNPSDTKNQYVGQVWKAINYYSRLLRNKAVILAGDFNSNSIWDKPRRIGNHTEVVNFLQRKGIRSAYHDFHRQEQGKEQHNTLFLYRHSDKPYHIDYCFLSAGLMKDLTSVQIGEHADWCSYSDHTPLTVTTRD